MGEIVIAPMVDDPTNCMLGREFAEVAASTAAAMPG